MGSELAVLSRIITDAASSIQIITTNTHGSSDGDAILWSFRRMDVPEHIIAGVEVYVKPDVFGEGFSVEIIACGYEYEKRDRAFSISYGGTYVRKELLANDVKKEEISVMLKSTLLRAWLDLPRFAKKLPEIEERRADALEELRRRGLLFRE